MPTLQEDRETYNKNIKNNMDIILHGNPEDVAKMADGFKAKNSERLSEELRAEGRNGGLHPVSDSAVENSSANAYRSAPVYRNNVGGANNSYSSNNNASVNNNGSASAAPRAKSLRPEPAEYRSQIEKAYYSNQQASRSAYDGINDQLRNNPRPSATPVFRPNTVNESAKASRMEHSAEARAVYRDLLTRSNPTVASPENNTLTRGDITPNALQNRKINDISSPIPTPDTMSRQRETISFDPNDMKEAKENADVRQSKQDTSIPTQVKVIAAVVAAAIILAFTVIFINSALLNSLNAEMEQLSVQVQTMSADAETLKGEIEVATSSETIEEYAKEAGMVYVGD